MSNTRPIQPVSVWSPSGPKTAIYLGLTNFSDYHFDGGGGTVSYTLIGLQDNGDYVIDDGTVVENPPSSVDLYNANLLVPSSVVQQWGESDSIIFEYVASQLGLTLINS
jgi:hypothetical protein